MAGSVSISVSAVIQKVSLFVGGRDPWCKPDLASVDDVVDVVKRCPTGAITFESNDHSVTETADAKTLLP